MVIKYPKFYFLEFTTLFKVYLKTGSFGSFFKHVKSLLWLQNQAFIHSFLQLSLSLSFSHSGTFCMILTIYSFTWGEAWYTYSSKIISLVYLLFSALNFLLLIVLIFIYFICFFIFCYIFCFLSSNKDFLSLPKCHKKIFNCNCMRF